jgi:hypothetical protein
MKFIEVFFVMLLLDYCWAVYNISSAEKRDFKAAFFSGLIVVFGAFLTLALVDNYWVIIPEILGAYAGTFIAVRCASPRT